MIDYTDKPARQEFPTTDDVKAFSRFLYANSAGSIRLSDEAATDAIGIAGVLSRAEEEHFAAGAGEPGMAVRRYLDVAEAALLQAAHETAAIVIESERQQEKLRSIAKLVAADIPAVDVVYAIRRVFSGDGE
jgi:hypothetical protein